MIANKLKIDGTEYDLPSGASAVVDGNNLIINNGNINNLKSSQLVTETMTVTTNAYGWVYFPENLLVITASVTDIYKHLVLDRYERPNGYQYIASTYLETNSNATYTKLASNKTYDVTYTYLKDVPINAGHNYSTEEKIVGTWIDGKTVYEKVINLDFAIDTSTQSGYDYTEGMADITKIIKQEGFFEYYGGLVPMGSFYEPSDTYTCVFWQFTPNQRINFQIGRQLRQTLVSQGKHLTGFVIIQYLKD